MRAGREDGTGSGGGGGRGGTDVTPARGANGPSWCIVSCAARREGLVAEEPSLPPMTGGRRPRDVSCVAAEVCVCVRASNAGRRQQRSTHSDFVADGAEHGRAEVSNGGIAVAAAPV
ncbi:hypothetical protein E2C01_017543 [Portunus trituberculatus]|uniref:Uncharacterized protein n=1 Tax=Portunus trituberculatus TaxID=210409 RepID=A0A5B7DS12_PORTR|nr:hypothetical protein [Portunus trituberculatus]